MYDSRKNPTHVTRRTHPCPLAAQYDALVGKLAPCAIPFLVSLGPCFQPCYTCSDATGICCVATDAQRPSASTKPIVIFASRTINDLGQYKAAFSTYAAAAVKGPGVRACFSFADREKANTVLQLLWLDSAADLPAASAGLVGCYAGSTASDFTLVWGSWDEQFKAKLEKDGKCRYSWVREVRGSVHDTSTTTWHHCTCTRTCHVHVHVHVRMHACVHVDVCVQMRGFLKEPSLQTEKGFATGLTAGEKGGGPLSASPSRLLQLSERRLSRSDARRLASTRRLAQPQRRPGQARAKRW